MDNFGHGHVYERPDGKRARCGGPGLCKECSVDQVRKDKAARPSGNSQEGWQPIETAPEDHFPVLVWHLQYGRGVAFRDVTWEWYSLPMARPLLKPTHWMQLPAQPGVAAPTAAPAEAFGKSGEVCTQLSAADVEAALYDARELREYLDSTQIEWIMYRAEVHRLGRIAAAPPAQPAHDKGETK